MATSPPAWSPPSSRSPGAASCSIPIAGEGALRRGHPARCCASGCRPNGRARSSSPICRPAAAPWRRAGSCARCPASCSSSGANLPMLLDFVHVAAPTTRTRRRARAAERGARRDHRARGAGVTLVLNRIDDRLIHGQVVVGWGQPLDVRFIVLVDDAVAASDWEQELYRMGVPPEMELRFHSAAEAAPLLDALSHRAAAGHPAHRRHRDDARARASHGGVREVNVGGIHHRAGRAQHLRYVFLTPEEQQALRDVAALGALVTAQDVPAARAVPARGDARPRGGRVRELLPLALLGGVLGLDVVCFPQMMISRPLVARDARRRVRRRRDDAGCSSARRSSSSRSPRCRSARRAIPSGARRPSSAARSPPRCTPQPAGTRDRRRARRRSRRRGSAAGRS